MIERAHAPALAPAKVPRHVAIIMDGNRRWAEEHRLAPVEGHRAGARALQQTVRAATAAGIEYLTVYAFSEENWQRSAAEVALLMDLLRAFAEEQRAPLVAENVRTRILGRSETLPPATRGALDALDEATRGGTGLQLNIAVNYGGRSELCDAIRALARDVADGTLEPAAIDGEMFASRLYTAGLPDPDLLIRTGGELRVSNFLLYQIAYTELWSTPVHWPDFDAARLDEALRAYAARQRRFGT
jgi:undecaprenyl diphosphate synthase